MGHLVLSLRVKQDFFVGDDCFVVDDILSDHSFVLRHNSTGRRYTIVADEKTEIMPNVMVFAGVQVEVQVARVAVDAPRSILVVRGDRKRNPPAHIRRTAPPDAGS